MKIINIVAIFLLTIFTAFGDSFLKRSGALKNTNYNYLIIGLYVYLLTGFIWFFIYKNIKFSSAGSIYGVATALIFAIVGVFYFKESIHPSEFIGIVLAITSILLLGRFGN